MAQDMINWEREGGGISSSRFNSRSRVSSERSSSITTSSSLSKGGWCISRSCRVSWLRRLSTSSSSSTGSIPYWSRSRARWSISRSRSNRNRGKDSSRTFWLWLISGTSRFWPSCWSSRLNSIHKVIRLIQLTKKQKQHQLERQQYILLTEWKEHLYWLTEWKQHLTT